MDELFAPIPEDLSALSREELEQLAEQTQARLDEIAADPAAYITPEFTAEQLVESARAARASLNDIRAALAETEEPENGDDDGDGSGEEEPDDTAAVSDTVAAELADLAAPAVDPEPVTEPEPVVAAVEDPEPVTAAALPTPTAATLRPARSRAAAPVQVAVPRISLTAATGAYHGIEIGSPIPEDGHTLGEMLLKRHALFGGPSGDRAPVAVARWADMYPSDRRLGLNERDNAEMIAEVTNPAVIKQELRARRESLTASGGWCAPPTPYYDLVSFGSTARPVRDALPGFDASRGGILHGRPATLTDINDAIGIVTAAEDEAGGTFGAKSCQVPDCPDFVTVQANAVFHCLQFGNMLSRAYPELVEQWTDLTMTALARLADSYLLTQIDGYSTQVTATGDLGAVAELLPQIVVAAVAMRSRHRMDADQVLRVLIPEWTLPMLVTDVIKSQFQRFDTDEARITAWLRNQNIEPTFYKDTASGRGQVFGAQSDGALLTFPSVVTWYLYPEGSFLYLDAGTLEIGLVRDSILNASNDFQIFGEFFENVAFIGVESLQVDSTVCATGVVAAPAQSDCPDMT